MQKVLAILITDLRIFLSDPQNLVGLLLIPAALVIAIGYAGGGGGTPRLDIAIIDQDQSEQSARFIEDIKAANPNFRLHASDSTPEEGRDLVAAGDVDALVVIPDNFSRAIMNLQPLAIPYSSSEDITSGSVIQQSMQAVISRWNGAVVAARVGEQVGNSLGIEVDARAIYDRATALLDDAPVQYDYTLTESDGETVGVGFEQSVPGMGSMFVLFTVLGGMGTLIRERQQWTLQRLIVTPVSRAQLLGGKILVYFTQGMLQYAVVFLIGLFFGVNFGSSPLALVLVAVVFTLAATSLTFALSTQIRSEAQASQLTTMLSLALAALGGAWWPLEIVPGFMKIIGHLSPVAWAMDAYHDLLYFERGLLDVLPEVGILLAIALVCFGVGIMGFQYE